MKEINVAYAVLSDPEKRRLYDLYGPAGLQGFTQEDLFRGVDFGSIFEEIFGRGFGGGIFDSFFGGRERRRSRQPSRGADLKYELEVSLEEVAFGAKKTIPLTKVAVCSACGGKGAEKGGWRECEKCHGSGQVAIEQRSGFTVFRQITNCPACKGKGKIITQPCKQCQGKGIMETTKEIKVDIPRGVDNGDRTRMAGEGEASLNGGQPGDLYVIFKVARHPVFERHGEDIYVVEEISFPEAALGTELKDIPGLEGKLKLEIPAGTQSGNLFRIAGKGLPRRNDYGRGDEYVMVKVVTPTNLTKEEKELLREFRKLTKNRG
jgi:molecular chaperone DnaJ